MNKSRSTCSISKRAFCLNGKEVFLYSGEVHYFRIPMRYWEKHIRALVDAGCNAVSTYVPWSWHEYEEGKFDISGKTHSERNLLGFIKLAAEHGLFVTLKPGPYVMAETTDQGIPGWLTSRYPETRALGENGQPWGNPFVSYMSTVMRDKAARWLTYFARSVVVPYQRKRKGAVIMLQLCNEIGIFSWLGMQADYSASSLAAWWMFLKHRFPRLEDLSRALDREISAYENVMPPRNVCSSRREYFLYELFHDYLRWAYADYVAFLAKTLRKAGVAVPLFANIGGWVFGRAHEFCMNATFHRETARKVPDVLYGLDHIPEFVSPLNAHDGIVANQLAMELQRRRGPIYSAELQCGSREHGVETYPPELALFYRECIAHGLTGMNFYMFAQGRNPKGRGTDGPMFYWYNAVDYKAHRQPTFDVVRDLGEWLRFNGARVIASERRASLGVVFYPHLHETELLFSTLHKRTRLDAAQIGLSADPLDFRTRAYFDGVIRILTKKSVPYDLVDVTVRNTKSLSAYPRLVLVTNEIMDPDSQQKLVDYVREGGELVVFPVLPRYDRNFAPCRIMEEAFGIHEEGVAASNRVYTERLSDIPVVLPPRILSARGGAVLARDVDGHVVGIEKSVGQGTVRAFGFFLYYSIEEHPTLWAEMMNLAQTPQSAGTDNDVLQVEFRKTGREGLLFIGNFHRTQRSSRVWVRDPRSGNRLDIGEVALPALTGLLMPIQAEITPAVRLLYAHAELLDRGQRAGRAVFGLRGPADMPCRLAIRVPKDIRRIRVDGQDVATRRVGDVIHAEYRQTGRRQTVEIG
jgi:beta-galactosidase